MRVAIISDIHANCVALDAALSEIQSSSVDSIVCLGDTVQGGPQPNETVERVRALGCPSVMGNSDDWLLKDVSDFVEPTTERQRDVRAWTLSTLSKENLAFIRSFKPTVKIPLDDNRSLLCFHGSPGSYDDILLPETPNGDWDRLLGPFSPAIMAGGHTHTQQLRRVRDGLFFNPGSIGFACDQTLPREKFRLDPWAEYAILSDDQRRLHVEFRRVQFDVEHYFSVVQNSGRPAANDLIAEYKVAPLQRTVDA
jgi:predicted phosphodiesterase